MNFRHSFIFGDEKTLNDFAKPQDEYNSLVLNKSITKNSMREDYVSISLDFDADSKSVNPLSGFKMASDHLGLEKVLLEWTDGNKFFHSNVPFVGLSSPGLYVYFTLSDDTVLTKNHVELVNSIVAGLFNNKNILVNFDDPYSTSYLSYNSHNISITQDQLVGLQDNSFLWYKRVDSIKDNIEFSNNLPEFVCNGAGNDCIDYAKNTGLSISTASLFRLEYDSDTILVQLYSPPSKSLKSESRNKNTLLNFTKDSDSYRIEVALLAREDEEVQNDRIDFLNGVIYDLGVENEKIKNKNKNKNKKSKNEKNNDLLIPKQTSINVRSRHLINSQGITYSCYFSQQVGLHPYYYIKLSALPELPAHDPKSDKCKLHALLTLPQDLFIDKYQYKSDFYSFSEANKVKLLKLWGESDLENPSYVVSRWGSFALLELSPSNKTIESYKNISVNDKTKSIPDPVLFKLPLHDRYQLPQINSSYTKSFLPWPIVYYACTPSDDPPIEIMNAYMEAGEPWNARLIRDKYANRRKETEKYLQMSPFDSPSSFYKYLYPPGTTFTHMLNNDSMYTDFIIPTANSNDYKFIQASTLVVILFGFFYIFYKSIAAAIRNKQNERLKEPKKKTE